MHLAILGKCLADRGDDSAVGSSGRGGAAVAADPRTGFGDVTASEGDAAGTGISAGAGAAAGGIDSAAFRACSCEIVTRAVRYERYAARSGFGDDNSARKSSWSRSSAKMNPRSPASNRVSACA